MKALSRAFLLVLVASLGMAQDLPSYKDLVFPEIRSVQVPEVTELELENGLHIYLLADRELPLINASAWIGTASVQDPPEKIGLAKLTGEVMRSGGIPGMSGDDMDERLEFLAASVETSIGEASGTASLQCLSEHIDEVLGIFAAVLMKPQFAKEKLELAKVALRTAISRRNDERSEILRREFRKALYGKNSPYSRQPEYTDVESISRDDLIAFHAANIGPENTHLAVWGDFDVEEMVEKLKRVFSNWEPKSRPELEFPQPEGLGPGGVFYVEKKDGNQANIRLGHLSVSQKHPDYVALQVLSNILGGGFSSRLMKEVRTRQGLAYSTYGVFYAPATHRGMFLAGCDTKYETTAQAVDAIMNELTRLCEEEVSEDELSLAKDSILNAWVFKFANPGAVVTRKMEYAALGFPEDFLETYRDKVAAVTAKDLLRVAREHLHPDKISLVVVGDASRFDRPLSELGKVTVVDISIPPPPLPPVSFDEPGRIAGLALVDRTVAAMGGDAFKNLKSVVAKGTMRRGPMLAMGTVSALLPDRQRVDLATPMGKMTILRNGRTVTQSIDAGGQSQSQSRELTESQLRAELMKDPQWLLLHGVGENAKIAAVQDVLVIEDADGFRVTLRFDSKGRVASLESVEAGEKMLRSFSDYRQIDSVWFAHKIQIKAGNSEAGGFVFSSITVNVDLDPDIFVNP